MNSPRNTWQQPGGGGGGFQKNWGGGCSMLPETISDLIKNLIPHFKPEALEPGVWPEHVTSCYGMYMVGVNIKMEMVLSPNDEEIASSKKHTQFKTRVPKPYSISAQNGQNWYPISDQNW